MQLVKPEIGLIVWMLISFGIIVFLLAKYAWPVILTALDEREKSITEALDSARKAKDDVAALKADNEKILAEARNMRDTMLKDARETKDKIVNEAKAKATEESDRLLKLARESIQNEKMAAITDLKNQVAQLSVDIAQKLLTEELSSPEKQKTLVKALLENVNLN
jgi:F-type H+-transporting ATPase subunit b